MYYSWRASSKRAW